MSQFVLDVGSPEGAERYNASSPFVRGYIEALFFTESGDIYDELNDCTVNDFAPSTWESIEIDCAEFERVAADLLAAAYTLDEDSYPYDAEQAGRDFWFTRNGHGVGFWDRAALKCDSVAGINGTLGAGLSALCGWRSSTGLGEVYAYVGDDGLVYLS